MNPVAWWRNRALRSKGLIVIAIPSVILLAAIVAVYVVDATENRADAIVTHSVRVRTDIERTLALMDRAETSVRSYLLVPRREFMSEYSRVRAEISDALARLHGLLEDDDDQTARLRSVETLIVDRLKALDIAGRLVDHDGLFIERSLRTGQAVLESLRGTLTIMQEDVERNLATQRGAAERQAMLARRLLLVGGLMGIGGGVVAAILFTAGLGDRMRALGDAARDISEGEFREMRVQPADDEIGLLGAQLREAARRLEEREQELRQARDDADAANRAKSEFLSRLSHELRTPVSLILSVAQMLQLSRLATDDVESVGEILRAGRYLLQLIDEVLETSKIEAGNIGLSPESVHVAEVLREAMELVRPMAGQRQVTIAGLDGDCEGVYVRADRQRLAQVLRNLLANAVNDSHPKGRVDVTTALGRTVFRIAVHDTGLGFAKADTDRAFEPFGRVTPGAGGIEGPSLGLSIARHLIAAMDGRIGVQSASGAGSVFWIELPLAAAVTGRSSPAQRRAV